MESNFLIPSGVATVGACAPTALGGSGFLIGSLPRPRVDRAGGVNGFATLIWFRNHKYSTLVEGLIFTRAHVWSLGMGMGRC